MKLRIFIGAGLAMFAMLAVTASAATNGKLTGTFAVTEEAQSSNSGIPVGTQIDRVYKFTCQDSRCNTSLFKRPGPSGRVFTSFLTKSAPGVYDGVEGPEEVDCGDGSTGQQTVTHHVEILRVNDKRNATKIKGASDYETPGCSPDPRTASWTFKGRRK